MERFNQDELAPIQKALQAFTDPHQQAAALSKACRIAQQVDERLQAGVTIEAHPEADELTKAVIGAVQALAKREKGSPLSDAELKQRQEAARSRKDGDAAGTAARGAAVAGAGALVGATAARAHAAVGARGRKGTTIYARMVDRDLNRPEPDFNLPRSNKFVRRGLAKPFARAGAAGAIAGTAIGAAVYGGKKLMDGRRAQKSVPVADLQKAIASLPLSKRAVAEGLMREGRNEDLQKFLGPALMAARAALPSVARAASAVGTRMFGAGAGAKAASGVMTAGRAGIRGAIGAERGIKAGAKMAGAAGKKAWGAAKRGGAAAATGISAAADSWQASRMTKPTSRTTPMKGGRPPGLVNPAPAGRRGWVD